MYSSSPESRVITVLTSVSEKTSRSLPMAFIPATLAALRGYARRASP